MNTAVNVVDVTEANFQEIMFERSKEQVVLLDFWAEWCAPCKALTPMLEKIAADLNGQILLAKINADEQANIVAQFGVQSLPTVAVVKDGQPIDAFQGAEPESVILERLQKHLPPIWDAALKQGQAHTAEQQYTEALPLLKSAYEDSQNQFEIGLLLADCYLHLKRSTECEELLINATMEQQLNPLYPELVAKLKLMQEAAETPEIIELQQKLAADESNLELKYELGLQYSQCDRFEEALQSLLEVLQVQLDFKDGNARKTMLDVLNSLGKGDPLAAKYQRKLFTLLY